MTEGISKERLIELYVENYSEEVTEELLLSECKELDPWLPIDENTPKDRPIWLWNGAKHLAARWNERSNDWWIVISFSDSKEPFTQYKLLPEDPS